MLYGIAYILSLLPFRFSSRCPMSPAWLACDVVRYRRSAVRGNLESSFRRKAVRKYAKSRNALLLSLRLLHGDAQARIDVGEKMRRHLKVENIEEINDAVEKGQSVTLYLGHYCNWEWVSSLPLHISSAARCAQIYHPLENKAFDRLLYKLRTRFDANNIPMSEIMQRLVRWKKEGVPTVTGYIADQSSGTQYPSFPRFPQS